MTIKQISYNLTLLIAFFIVAVSCQNAEKGKKEMKNESSHSSPAAPVDKGQAFIKDDGSTPNVLQIAIGSKDHTTLVKAVQAAKLENVLVNAGPLTVFAPTNEAFAKLPAGTVENLLKPENIPTLAAILKHHVTPGNYGKDLLKKFNGKKLGQADDTSVDVMVKGEDVYVGGAKIIGSVKAGNGVVHVVDKVILPPTK